MTMFNFHFPFVTELKEATEMDNIGYLFDTIKEFRQRGLEVIFRSNHQILHDGMFIRWSIIQLVTFLGGQ